MSVIFGTCLARDSVVDENLLGRLARATARYGIDGTSTYCNNEIGMGFQAFHTHDQLQTEHQPNVDHFGNILAFDGRLDNHIDLAAKSGVTGDRISDSSLILMAFERLGVDCFSHLVGDWALALWSARERALYLARDHAGSRTLFYTNEPGQIRWSTYLETFFAENAFPKLDKDYIARVLSSQSVGDLTPYRGIWSVPPSHYLVARRGEVKIVPHWRWVATKRITYQSETEYDEHFLELFRQAVKRRIGSGAPILAQLSGGVDSSSIVCMADKIRTDGCLQVQHLDTVSYYDDSEPDWDERPYFTAVEAQRNRVGIHIDCSSRVPHYDPVDLPDRIYPYPGADALSLDAAREFERSVGAKPYRVILSGMGGDELLGGVPTAMPELANLLQAGSVVGLISRASKWCMVSRQPLYRMVADTVMFTGRLYAGARSSRDAVPPWLTADLRQRCLRSSSRRETLRDLLDASPSALSSGYVWWAMLETLPHRHPQLLGCYEYRYPYLDRDLVDFLHQIPREQLVQPGRRRVLMRRALKHIVPATILERKRKAFVSHSPLTNLRNAQQEIEKLFSSPLVAEYGLIDRDRYLSTFRTELVGDLKWIRPLTTTIRLELWLRSLEVQRMKIKFASGNHQEATVVRPVTARANRIRASDALQ